MYEIRSLGLGQMTPEQASEQKMFEEFSRMHMVNPEAAWQWLDQQRRRVAQPERQAARTDRRQRP